MLDQILSKINSVKDEEELELQRKNDQYLIEWSKTILQVSSTWCISVCIIILSVGFIVIFLKYIYYITLNSEVDNTTQKILSDVLDWTMKIVVGWLLKAHFDKK